VIDEFGEGYAATFCMSSKKIHAMAVVLFLKIMEVTGSLTLHDVFMSDDAATF